MQLPCCRSVPSFHLSDPEPCFKVNLIKKPSTPHKAVTSFLVVPHYHCYLLDGITINLETELPTCMCLHSYILAGFFNFLKTRLLGF